VKIDNEFTVGVPVEQAWNTMLDLERVAPCLPGAAIQESTGESEYRGTMKVKIGPITASYRGTVKVDEADQENHRAVVNASGRDARGQGTASATIVSTLQEEGDNTRVKVETDMKLTGRAAQFGRGIAQDVATKMFDQFAECLEREISGGGAAQEAAASSETPEGDGAATQAAPTAAPTSGTAGRVISSEDPSVMAGRTVEGAIVSDDAPQAGASTGAPHREPEEQEAFDLGAASKEAIVKRAAPVLAGLGLLVFLIWLIRR
jgi:uncharacterized protein